MQRYFCKVYDYGEKAHLSKTNILLESKTKMWVTATLYASVYGNFFPNLSSITMYL